VGAQSVWVGAECVGERGGAGGRGLVGTLGRPETRGCPGKVKGMGSCHGAGGLGKARMDSDGGSKGGS
jgi:hypothetical protein